MFTAYQLPSRNCMINYGSVSNQTANDCAEELIQYLSDDGIAQLHHLLYQTTVDEYLRWERINLDEIFAFCLEDKWRMNKKKWSHPQLQLLLPYARWRFSVQSQYLQHDLEDIEVINYRSQHRAKRQAFIALNQVISFQQNAPFWALAFSCHSPFLDYWEYKAWGLNFITEMQRERPLKLIDIR